MGWGAGGGGCTGAADDVGGGGLEDRAVHEQPAVAAGVSGILVLRRSTGAGL